MTAAVDHPAPRLMPGAHVHLVGIGGAGMSALARILLERGHPVSGSDLRGSKAVAALAAMGAQVFVGHAAEHVGPADVVVASTAIPAGNPEVARAVERGLPVWRRAELLAALTAGHRALLVAGAHGKTTTTSMVTVALQAAGLDPSFAIGGTLHDSGASGHHGTGDVFVAEADESDRSFLVLAPDCAVVTNIDLDHHDHYADEEELAGAFAAFLGRRAPGAVAVLCRDDPGVAALLERIAGPVVTYGEHPEATLRITDVELDERGSRFAIVDERGEVAPHQLRLAGRHNVLNAAAAAAAARWAGAPVAAVQAGLAEFTGAQRRFQRLGTAAGVSVVDDYAHHPAELAATIAAARQAWPHGRIVAAFQPHRYSRTAALGGRLGAALAAADVVLVTDVYAAGESPVPGVTGALVADAARAAGADTGYLRSTQEVLDRLAAVARAGDVVLTLGAGDITEIGPVLLERLERRRG